MKRIVIALVMAWLVVTALGAGKAPPAPPSFPEKPTLARPQGVYRVGWLSLEGAGKPVWVFLALREGRPVQFWSTQMQLPGAPKAQGSPKLLVDELRGQTEGNAITAQVDLRLVSVWAPMTRFAAMTLAFALSLQADGANVTGTWTNKVGDATTRGTVRGTILDEPAAREAQGIAPGQDWPSFYGMLAACRGPEYGKPLIDDLAQARPMWRSETVCLSGWGTGVDSRYKTRAAYGTLCGGSSSPVVADGRVYLYHYRPSGDVEPAGADAELVARFKDEPHEADAMRRYFSKRADIVMSCIDGATGKTVWESVWPRKQGNYQTHKWRGNNHTPSVAKGIVVASDYSWGLYAHDARTGELKWTRDGGGDIPKDQGAVGPVISGDVVVWTSRGGAVGLDLASGKELWKVASKATSARRMIIDGKERVLLVGDPLILVDPATGAEVARGAFPGGFEKKGRREVGRALGANLVCEGPCIVTFDTKEVDRKPMGTLIAMKVAGNAIELAWKSDVTAAMEDGHIALCIAGGHVFTAFQEQGAYCMELATGKTVKHLPDFKAQSNPIFVAVDNRIFWQPECQHGRQRIQLFDATPASFGPLGTNWTPPHNDTTAYGEMPTANVVVDGRLIIRGMDGIYCYDVRRQNAKRNE